MEMTLGMVGGEMMYADDGVGRDGVACDGSYAVWGGVAGENGRNGWKEPECFVQAGEHIGEFSGGGFEVNFSC